MSRYRLLQLIDGRIELARFWGGYDTLEEAIAAVHPDDPEKYVVRDFETKEIVWSAHLPNQCQPPTPTTSTFRP